ncbi:MAG: penicillin-binding protein 1C [Robiginitomaculum sp.]|nr:MAG: penicillin-binding protein 1C [Robiginitomaculum sp.]
MIKLAAAAAGACLVLITVGFHLWSRPQASIPNYSSVRDSWKPSYSSLVDRNGESLGEIRTNFSVRRMQWVSYPQLSPALIDVMVTAEDKRFWQHGGVDWLALAQAARTNGKARHKRGASTITMQLAANLTRNGRSASRRGIRQKFQQIRLAHQMERNWSKQQILETWLNRIDFRGEVQGIGAASFLFAGKMAGGITRIEALGLAAMVPAPNAPLTVLARRACKTAERLQPMQDCAPITAFLQKTSQRNANLSEHNLAFHVKRRLSGSTGSVIKTNLDANLQRAAEKILANHLRRLKHRNVRDGAVLVVDNQSGNILAWVGSNPASSKARHVDGVTAKRQAGSSLKPFLYELAIENRILNASSILDDSQLELESVQGIYAPQNYDHRFVGPVSVRHALGNSMNIPAVKTLRLVGIEAFLERLQQLGYSDLDQSAEYYGFALALGSVEVSLLEQVRAYHALANGGKLGPLLLTPDDKKLVPVPVMSPASSFITADMMADPTARQYTFGRNSRLDTPFGASVKTGTSKAMRDNWCIGFTSRYTVGVWVGNFEGDSMTNVSGTSGAAPIWREMIDLVQAGQPPLPTLTPDGIEKMHVSFVPAIEPARPELFLTGMGRSIVQVVTNDDLQPYVSQPADGTIIALDPDIPPQNQMMRIAIAGKTTGLNLTLDNQSINPNQLWLPIPGSHLLTIRDSDQNLIDQVRFSVR